MRINLKMRIPRIPDLRAGRIHFPFAFQAICTRDTYTWYRSTFEHRAFREMNIPEHDIHIQ